eukprot:Protomagalhaensia_sp_Gyna_25__700@NODE_1329_length_1941_cov_9_825447_g1061_i0_p1_GENE_NODE_1329_length_1941_cov_9_825447_g1061_i0NODE_1329_length_1941_cov_9_825447_g1061_i0_p1_ORF_typecomplete_len598_score84_78_NODE_1329_length_1941_cov_9_825447_g1061_i0341827
MSSSSSADDYLSALLRGGAALADATVEESPEGEKEEGLVEQPSGRYEISERLAKYLNPWIDPSSLEDAMPHGQSPELLKDLETPSYAAGAFCNSLDSQTVSEESLLGAEEWAPSALVALPIPVPAPPLPAWRPLPALAAPPPMPRFLASIYSRLSASSEPFGSADSLRVLAAATFVVTRRLCPVCGPAVAAPEEDVCVALSRCSWSDLRPTHGAVLAPAARGTELSFGDAACVLLLFVYWLQQRESARRRSSAGAPLRIVLSVLAAALSFLATVQRADHGPRLARSGGCCGCPGFAERRVRGSGGGDSELAIPDKRVRAIPAKLLARLLSESRSLLLPLASRLHSAADDAILRRPDTNDDDTTEVVIRDCVAVTEILRRLCSAIFVASAWVDELEPLSSAVIGDFLTVSVSALSRAAPCRRSMPTHHHHQMLKASLSSPTSGDSFSGMKSRAVQLKRFAAVTASTISGACMNSDSVELIESPTCLICREARRLSPGKEMPSLSTPTLTSFDFERLTFILLSYINYDMRVDPLVFWSYAKILLRLTQRHSIQQHEGKPLKAVLSRGSVMTSTSTNSTIVPSSCQTMPSFASSWVLDAD